MRDPTLVNPNTGIRPLPDLSNLLVPAIERFFDDELIEGSHRIGVISFFADVRHLRARRNYTPQVITITPLFLDNGNKRNGYIGGRESTFRADPVSLNGQPTFKATMSAVLSKDAEPYDTQAFKVRLNRAGDLELSPQTWPALGVQTVKVEEKFYGCFAFANNRIAGTMEIKTGAFEIFDPVFPGG